MPTTEDIQLVLFGVFLVILFVIWPLLVNHMAKLSFIHHFKKAAPQCKFRCLSIDKKRVDLTYGAHTIKIGNPVHNFFWSGISNGGIPQAAFLTYQTQISPTKPRTHVLWEISACLIKAHPQGEEVLNQVLVSKNIKKGFSFPFASVIGDFSRWVKISIT